MQFHSPLRTFPKVPTSLRVLLTALALFLIGQPGYTSDTQRQPAVSDIQPQMSPVEPAEPVVTLLDMRDFAWREGGLRQAYFQDREIIENDDVIELDAPGRADDGTKVPLKISAKIPQTEERYIKTVTVLIDNNPSPFAGRFMFTPKSGNANLFLRVRVNDYTAIRAIAETNDGELFMSKRFVKASGGCSAPPPPDMEKALERMGKMTFRTRTEAPVEPIAAMLNIRHPNTTGMQFYHVTQEFIPAHYVQTVNITFNGEYVMTAETGFSMSEDPSLGFYFVPDRDGELRAEITDSEGLSFTKVHKLKVVQD